MIVERNSVVRVASDLSRVLALCVLVGSGCQKATHDDIERWQTTQKGPTKLRETLSDPALTADLRGHAAEALVVIEGPAEVVTALEVMDEATRNAVIADLLPRLWEEAKITQENVKPTSRQSTAKDALFEIRNLANAEARAEIDQYLIEWFTAGYYEARAVSGRMTGKQVLRTIGPAAGSDMIASTNRLLARKAEREGYKVKVGDQLLLGLAVTGDPEAAGMVLKFVRENRGDPTLPERAMAALYEAYVEPTAVPPADRAGLLPHAPVLLSYARARDLSGRVNNDAVALIGAMGMPACLEGFVSLVKASGEDSRRARSLRWIGVQQGIRCGKAEAMIPMAEALPTTVAYERAILDKYFWKEVREAATEEDIAQRAQSFAVVAELGWPGLAVWS